MEEEVDTFPFVLAEALHMTIGDIYARMSNREYIAWQAFYTWRAAMEKLHAKRSAL